VSVPLKHPTLLTGRKESQEEVSLRYAYREYKRGEAPLLKFLPLPLIKGKGDKGG